jgi:hypothetical protein
MNEPAQRQNAPHIEIVAHDERPRTQVKALATREQQAVRVG